MRSAESIAAIVEGGSPTTVARIAQTLAAFGARAIGFARARRIRIVPLDDGRRYHDVSTALRRLGVDVDGWPIPPAGLFVVEERTIYLRSPTPMTIAHEFAHGLDCALGNGVYRSGYDSVVRGAFARARSFVTPYAATGLDEYFAECVRAHVEVNDARSPWPAATRARLADVDPTMHAFVRELFAGLPAR